jgi:prephenate dehydratase
MNHCNKVQKRMLGNNMEDRQRKKTGFLGPRGTFTEEAARILAGNGDVEFVPYPTIIDVLDAVESQEIDQGIVPIENSLEGSVNTTMDWLAHEGDLFIWAEIVLPIEHHLLGLPETRLDAVEEVLSHPQAVAQCRKYLRSRMPAARVAYTNSTADAAEQVAQRGTPTVAAIGTTLAARLYGLRVIESGIQDEEENYTRFIMVGKGEAAPVPGDRSRYKTSLLVTLAKDHPGALHHVLSAFARENINLTRIESRPTRKSLGSYHFFIDVECHQEAACMQRACREIAGYGATVRSFGTYPQHQRLPEGTVSEEMNRS